MGKKNKTDCVDRKVDEKLSDLEVARKLVSLQHSASSRNIEFSLSFRKVRALMLVKTCYYTGMKFDNTENIRSIDRVVNSLGYIDGNVVACTAEINMKKNNMTPEELKAVFLGLQKHQDKKKSGNKRGVIRRARFSANAMKAIVSGTSLVAAETK